jgi:NAD(P)H-dependent flavin oxidoreductase YrpB (nitropropane dioxygenase family)
MPEVNQYTVTPKELLELIVKSAGVREGRWHLIANFGFAPGNFGPVPAQMVPGVAVVIQSLGIQREVPEARIPPELVIDAAKIGAAPEREATTARHGKSKGSTQASS